MRARLPELLIVASGRRKEMPQRSATGTHLGPSQSLTKKVRGAVPTMIEALESRRLLSASWFVSTTGADTNPGTLAAPFRTIQHAANLAQPGDTVQIRGGIYRETVTVAH